MAEITQMAARKGAPKAPGLWSTGGGDPIGNWSSTGTLSGGGPGRWNANKNPPTGRYEDYLKGGQRDAFLALKSLFESYGLGSLAGKIYGYIQNGYTAEQISMLLQDTKEYKQRFAANEERKKKGLTVLSPAEYLSVENSYRQLMRQSGLPAGFYDQNSDFTEFISKDVSPTELQSRVELASQATALASDTYKQALQEMYGLGAGEITAYFLDPDRALPLLQKRAAASQIGAEALRFGGKTDVDRFEEYAKSGITGDRAREVFGSVAQELPDYQRLGSIFGQDVTQAEAERAGFFGGTDAQKLTRLQSWNRARAQGAAGGARSGLARHTSGQV